MSRSSTTALVITALLATAAPLAAHLDHRPGTTGQDWVGTWASMPQLTEPHNMPPAPFTGDGVVLVDSTLRQTVRVSVGGERMRLRFSNAFGGAPLPLTAVTVALPEGDKAGVASVRPNTTHRITFHGKDSTVVPVGAQVVSDPIDFRLAPRTNLTVTTYLAEGQASDRITSHPGSRTTSHLLRGNHVAAQTMTGSTPTDHWYFLSGVEVRTKRDGKAVVTLGDSLTDGRGSTTNGNNRWPDQFLARLHAHRRTDDVALLNQGAGGNRVLNDGLGPNALARLDRDVLAQSGARWLVVFEGVNDIGTAPATAEAQRKVAEDLIAAYDQIVVRAHAQDIRVYGATLTPFGGNTNYDDPEGHRESARQAVNTWIRTSGRFDAVIDFDAATRDPARPRDLLPAYDDGDHLHLNPTGYRALADAVPLNLFTG
ncbi:SGNH/GDSL hydrolase family protein [Saccharothrix coeruleofusca]|uniref:SGNH hydrolase n=1 Tax=Saccharothrix coeruleofusca TaxID=33919 RepID=A0A918AU80_9PSEU|nr:SGNH/GDSL hydrolase family protein [Saccharothrix coeruleofusca]MBP2335670.1 lysophospholipase L1-like esterase [Saccharothrix coeruleofusca]GGP86456.1 SGNH hydrolase [Saccharothrix coeruleofusca]